MSTLSTLIVFGSVVLFAAVVLLIAARHKPITPVDRYCSLVDRICECPPGRCRGGDG